MSHEQILPDRISAGDVYRLMTDLVAPRPIAWVSTVDAQGRANLAPFSYYQAVCSAPPIVSLSIAWSGGRPKDTLANILETRQFTISHVDRGHASQMNETSAVLEPGHSEWEEVGVEAEASSLVSPARVAASRAALECRLLHAIPLGQASGGGPSVTLVLGQVLCFQVEKGLFERDATGAMRPIDPEKLDAVGRLGGIAYTSTRESFRLPRPGGPR